MKPTIEKARKFRESNGIDIPEWNSIFDIILRQFAEHCIKEHKKSLKEQPGHCNGPKGCETKQYSDKDKECTDCINDHNNWEYRNQSKEQPEESEDVTRICTLKEINCTDRLITGWCKYKEKCKFVKITSNILKL